MWALGSQSTYGSVGLLIRKREQIEDDARQSGTNCKALKRDILAQYSGHRKTVTSVSVHSLRDGDTTIWALASGSSDHTVGLLLRKHEQIEEDSRHLGEDNEGSNPGHLARYAGHRETVTSVSIHCQSDGERTLWALASGSADHTVGLLLREREQIEVDARRSGAEHEGPNPGMLARYSGHSESVNSVSLDRHGCGKRTIWALASGSIDHTVGLLLREREQVEVDAQRSSARHNAPIAGHIARYAGHLHQVTSVSLLVHCGSSTNAMAVVSGSHDETVGLLLREHRQVYNEARISRPKQVFPNNHIQTRYAGYRTSVKSVSLQCQRNGDRTELALASRSRDGTFGLERCLKTPRPPRAAIP